MDNDIIDEIFMNYELDLEKAVEFLKSEFLQIRAGRANPHILDKVLVDYYGTMTPLNQMSNISVQDARMLVISVWDNSKLKDVIKAINASDIGINPTDDGRVIRLVFPPLTEERRISLVKDVKKLGEDAKIGGRNARRDAVEAVRKLKKDSLITEDDLASYESDIQKQLEKFNDQIDKLCADKEKEVLTI